MSGVESSSEIYAYILIPYDIYIYILIAVVVAAAAVAVPLSDCLACLFVLATTRPFIIKTLYKI